jgi:hypothetical protein
MLVGPEDDMATIARCFERAYAALFTFALVMMGLSAVASNCGCHTVADVSGHTRDVAQREADAFIAEMGLKAKAGCADRDTDGDGYVSCPLVFGDGRMEALECAGSLTINSGCRPPKAVVRSGP